MYLPIQIVNDKDEPIGEGTVDEAQQKGLIHRVARIMVEDGQGNILLQKRLATDNVFPDCWDNSAAGHVDAGESYEVAARRELEEEIGLKDVTLNEVGYYRSNGKYQSRILNRFVRVYKAHATLETAFHLQPEEVSAVKWFTIAEAKRLTVDHPDQVSDGLIEVLERFY